MREFTFLVNEKEEPLVISDIRAYAIQLSSLIVNSCQGLPSNLDDFPALNRFYQEYNVDSTIEQIHDEIGRAIAKFFPSLNANVQISTVSPNDRTDLRPYMSVSIKLTEISGRTGTIVLGISGGVNGISIKDINAF